jgi:hypothetical protein
LKRQVAPRLKIKDVRNLQIEDSMEKKVTINSTSQVKFNISAIRNKAFSNKNNKTIGFKNN